MRARFDDDVYAEFKDVRFGTFCLLVEERNGNDLYSPITLYYEGTNSRGDVSIACSPGNNKAKSKFLEYAGDLLSNSL